MNIFFMLARYTLYSNQAKKVVDATPGRIGLGKSTVNIADTLTHWARAQREAIEANDAALEALAVNRYMRTCAQLASCGANHG
jgi:hypothetical protein